MIDPPGLHVEIVRYVGKNGGYARTMETLWIARLVSADGRRRLTDQNTWHGHMEQTVAFGQAEDWASFLSCPIYHREAGPSHPPGMPPQKNDLIPYSEGWQL